MLINATTSLGQAFAAILSGMRALLANHAPRQHHASGLVALVYTRITRMVVRLDALALRWRAGTLPGPRPRPGHPRQAAPAPLRVSRRRFWLIHIAQPTAQSISRVENFLANPEARTLVEAAPQAGRILRPLCHALGIQAPEWLRLPERPPPVRKPRPRPVAPAPGTPDRPLPAYIRAAVRAWKPKYG